MATWPEVIKTRGKLTSTPMLDYEFRPVNSLTTYYGQTNMSYDQLGESNLVYCTRPRKFSKPKGWEFFSREAKFFFYLNRKLQYARQKGNAPLMSRFQARRVNQTCTDEVYTWDYPYPGPRVKLTGKLAAYQFLRVADQRPLGFPGWDDDLSSGALMKAYSNIIGSQAEVGTMLGELRETLTYLRAPMRSATKLFAQFIKAKGRKQTGKMLRVGMDAVSNEWMAFRYGIRPLMKDISDLMSLSARIMDGDSHRSSGSATRPPVVSYTDSQDSILNLYFKWRSVMTTSQKGYAKIYWKYSPTATPAGVLMDQLQLNWHDIPSVAWELVPLSFVVDWFVNVGAWLKAVRPKPNSSIMGNCVSIKTETAIEKYCTGVYSSYTGYPAQSCATSRAHSVTSIIDRNVDLPFPSMPTLNPSILGVARELDAITLIWQRLPNLITRR